MSHSTKPPQAPKLQLWSIAIWVALLWSCYVENMFLQHMGAMRQMGTAGWLAPVANFILIVICLAALLRIHWARPALRLAAAVTVLWIPFSARHELSLWRQMAQPPAAGEPSALLAMQASMQQQLHWVLGMDMALKLVLMAFWLWLCWRLGRSDVAPFFHRRRKSRG